ncbi:hypothetical protein H6G54_24720 [Anabaena cylindrica FACHB-243]|uniref:hypothetical protein n=1 Tax=Anabaena TaxID=1163 RepID=UPI00030EFA0F|nr:MULTISPECIES: hypothetical protein [Anabaena]MBD2420847.1 hypothetical protein [Anabaena cylindrica FACHB-243]MBY5285488.1 hypothetical protein [Anabaena sp. CCAP 1446/1C]MBY5311143.1 hypothetical protein [Anabaena sp. CCAP 1446/1C]MCM2409786.1 hypothetical protein [Anabaena sp. CCAP 1446/1C]
MGYVFAAGDEEYKREPIFSVLVKPINIYSAEYRVPSAESEECLLISQTVNA